jgi:hypothetical protein
MFRAAGREDASLVDRLATSMPPRRTWCGVGEPSGGPISGLALAAIARLPARAPPHASGTPPIALNLHRGSRRDQSVSASTPSVSLLDCRACALHWEASKSGQPFCETLKLASCSSAHPPPLAFLLPLTELCWIFRPNLAMSASVRARLNAADLASSRRAQTRSSSDHDSRPMTTNASAFPQPQARHTKEFTQAPAGLVSSHRARTWRRPAVHPSGSACSIFCQPRSRGWRSPGRWRTSPQWSDLVTGPHKATCSPTLARSLAYRWLDVPRDNEPSSSGEAWICQRCSNTLRSSALARSSTCSRLLGKFLPARLM